MWSGDAGRTTTPDSERNFTRPADGVFEWGTCFAFGGGCEPQVRAEDLVPFRKPQVASQPPPRQKPAADSG